MTITKGVCRKNKTLCE